MHASDLDLVVARRRRRGRRWVAVAALAAVATAAVGLVVRDSSEPELAVRTETARPDDQPAARNEVEVEAYTTMSTRPPSTTTSSGAPPADPVVTAQRRRPNPTTTSTTATPSTTTSTSPVTTTTNQPNPPPGSTPTAHPCDRSRTLTETGLYVAPINGDSPKRILADSGLDANDVVASPDGRRIFFTIFDRSNDGQNPFELYAANIDGSGLRRIEAGTQHPQNLAWSPDGRWIAFNDQSPRGAPVAVWVMSPDGSQRHKVWDNPSHGSGWIRWSPDGTRLATHSVASDGGAWVIDLTTTRAATKIVSEPVWVVDWAPDGQRLAVDITVTVPVDAPAGYAIDPAPVIIINADGTGRRQLVEDGSSPRWSPAGDGIALRDGQLIDPDTLETEWYGAGTAVAYSPDGEHLAATGGGIWINDRRGCAIRLFATNQRGDPSWRGWAGNDHVLVEMHGW